MDLVARDAYRVSTAYRRGRIVGKEAWNVAARTPEELETLLEDALVLHDASALAELFAPDAVLAVDEALTARGDAIPDTALALLSNGRAYVADPQRVLEARDIALIVTERGVNVARRGSDGGWRYAIVRQSTGRIDEGQGKETSSWS